MLKKEILTQVVSTINTCQTHLYTEKQAAWVVGQERPLNRLDVTAYRAFENMVKWFGFIDFTNSHVPRRDYLLSNWYVVTLSSQPGHFRVSKCKPFPPKFILRRVLRKACGSLILEWTRLVPDQLFLRASRSKAKQTVPSFGTNEEPWQHVKLSQSFGKLSLNIPSRHS